MIGHAVDDAELSGSPRTTAAMMTATAVTPYRLEKSNVALKELPAAGESKALARSRASIAYAQMRELILANKWSPGFQITEQDAATLLSMSRTPVREAMMQLQQEGLAVVVPRHGLKVLPISPEDMNHIYTILSSLEATAAELAAARRLSAADIAPMEEASEAMARALEADDMDSWAQADERFHHTLLDLCGNPKLKAIVVNFMDRVHRARKLTLPLRPAPRASTEEHHALVEAIRRGDAAAAGQIHRAHRERAKHEMLALLEKLGLHQV